MSRTEKPQVERKQASTEAPKAGQTLTLTVTGAKADGTQVDFDFPDAVPGDLDFPFAKVTNAAGTKVTQKKITVVNAGVYVLRFTTAGGDGAYKAVIKLTAPPPG